MQGSFERTTRTVFLADTAWIGSRVCAVYRFISYPNPGINDQRLANLQLYTPHYPPNKPSLDALFAVNGASE